jgi:catechol O-methyltransferase
MTSISNIRKKGNGPMKFHKTTEKELLQYVLENADSNVASVIKTIDDFCWNNHWMMHVGDEKGKILSNVIKKANPMNVLELGTYCGYSCLRMLEHMTHADSKVYTIDPNIETVNSIAKPILKLAGVLDRVVFLSGYSEEVIPNIKDVVFDAVFFDHAKRQYYSDLLSLEKLGLVDLRTTLIADNVIVFNISDYRQYVEDSGKFNTVIKYTNVEYNNENDAKVMTDGVVISTYK